MASLRARFYKKLLRHYVRNGLVGNTADDVKKAREREGRGLLKYIVPTKAAPEGFRIGDIYAEWQGAADAPHTLLYLHGGGYMVGSPTTHRHMVQQLCHLANMRALVIDYRLAPENPFPAAIEDAEQSYDWLLAQGIDPSKLFVAGDSAGGGLTLALMQRLKQAGKALPKALALLSPWTDLTMSGISISERADRDDMIDPARIPLAVDFYRGDAPADDPLISPLFADFADFPPMFVQVGSEEVLYDDSARLVERARQAGCSARLQIWPDMPHVHQIAFGLIPEGRAALHDIARFLAEHRQ